MNRTPAVVRVGPRSCCQANTVRSGRSIFEEATFSVRFHTASARSGRSTNRDELAAIVIQSHCEPSRINLTRTVVVENSGSGTSWLSEQFAISLGGAGADFALVNWEPGGYNLARKREEVISMARVAAAEECWVIEGIYGWIVSEILPAASALVWIDVDEAECVANIHQRGMRRGADAQSLAELLGWAESYCSRSGSSSYGAHKAIYNAFEGPKARLKSRVQVTAFASSFA
ncbi:adenylate kinase [Burkholderia gladioli]|uniref:adenylate kinase n=1 Tax=Burkholderia gladioli TaxID=28095 RepID=UPI001FC7E5A0|nr:adenylate kinase [Burkholderia gladioli]